MQRRYQWPASRLTRADMQALFRIREGGPSRVPICVLVANAVRAACEQQQPSSHQEAPCEAPAGLPQ